jgi:hypothetical protein
MAKGKKTGGRKRGTPNRATTAVAIRAEVAASGETPLDYMLRVMRDESVESSRRDEMAKAVAPYVHPKLAAVEQQISGKDGGDPIRMLIDQIDGTSRGLPSDTVTTS